MGRKLRGLMLIEALGLPHPPWVYGSAEHVLEKLKTMKPPLTVRTDVLEDSLVLGLPRLVPARTLEEAEEFIKKHGTKYIYIIYPFLTAQVSGTVMFISEGRLLIEGVEGDCWNLLQYGRVDFRWEPPKPPEGRWQDLISEQRLLDIFRFGSRIPKEYLAEWLVTPEGKLYFVDLYPVSGAGGGPGGI